LPHNSLIQHPKGGFNFGSIPDLPKHHIPGGGIYLKRGVHRSKNRGFGVAHIWAEHQKDLMRLGYSQESDVVRYVADIIQNSTPIYYEGASMKAPRVAVLRSRLGILIAEHRPLQDPALAYSVITAYPKGQAHGVLVGNIQKAP
jgi:hypothetical protein